MGENQDLSQDIHPTQAAVLAVLASSMEQVKREVSETRNEIKDMRREIADNYVRKEQFNSVENSYIKREEFAPVKSIVYGLVGLIMVSVVSAILALVVLQR